MSLLTLLVETDFGEKIALLYAITNFTYKLYLWTKLSTDQLCSVHLRSISWSGGFSYHPNWQQLFMEQQESQNKVTKVTL